MILAGIVQHNYSKRYKNDTSLSNLFNLILGRIKIFLPNQFPENKQIKRTKALRLKKFFDSYKKGGVF